MKVKLNTFSVGTKMILQNDSDPNLIETKFMAFISGRDFDFVNSLRCLVIGIKHSLPTNVYIVKRDLPFFETEKNVLKNISNPVVNNNFWHIKQICSMPDNILEWDDLDFAQWVFSSLIFFNNINSYWSTNRYGSEYNRKNFVNLFDIVLKDLNNCKIRDITPYSKPFRHKIISELRHLERLFTSGILKYIDRVQSMLLDTSSLLINMLKSGVIQSINDEELTTAMSTFGPALHNYRMKGNLCLEQDKN